DRDLAAGGIEAELIRTIRHRHRCTLIDGKAVQAPEKDAQARDIVPPDHICAVAEVGGVEELIEGALRPGSAVTVAQVGPSSDSGSCPEACEPFFLLQRRGARGIAGIGGPAERRIEIMACASEAAEEFDDPRIPAGDVCRDLFENCNRTFSASVV